MKDEWSTWEKAMDDTFRKLTEIAETWQSKTGIHRLQHLQGISANVFIEKICPEKVAT